MLLLTLLTQVALASPTIIEDVKLQNETISLAGRWQCNPIKVNQDRTTEGSLIIYKLPYSAIGTNIAKLRGHYLTVRLEEHNDEICPILERFQDHLVTRFMHYPVNLERKLSFSRNQSILEDIKLSLEFEGLELNLTSERNLPLQ